jgi:hypothetical protein
MRFAPIFLLVGASFCSAQTVTVPNNIECVAARIVTPPDTFTMPVAKTPDMQTMKRSVISTKPACAQARPKPLIAKRIQVPSAPPVKPRRLELLPNPFTPLTK